jgi:hypothetical protein
MRRRRRWTVMMIWNILTELQISCVIARECKYSTNVY